VRGTYKRKRSRQKGKRGLQSMDGNENSKEGVSQIHEMAYGNTPRIKESVSMRRGKFTYKMFFPKDCVRKRQSLRLRCDWASHWLSSLKQYIFADHSASSEEKRAGGENHLSPRKNRKDKDNNKAGSKDYLREKESEANGNCRW